MRILLTLLLLLTILPLSAQDTTSTLGLVQLESMARVQTEVWIDGRRAGITPIQAELPVGEHWLTASSESVKPLMQKVIVQPGGRQALLLPADPVTTENYERVSRWVMSEIPRNRTNPHIYIIALHLTVDPAEGEHLLRMAEAELPGDPMLEILRAKLMLRKGALDEALVAAEKGLRGHLKLGFAWRVRAEALNANGRSKEALDSANQAVIVEPFSWRNLRIRAKVHESLGNERARLADERRAEELYIGMHEQIQKMKAAQ